MRDTIVLRTKDSLGLGEDQRWFDCSMFDGLFLTMSELITELDKVYASIEIEKCTRDSSLIASGKKEEAQVGYRIRFD